MSTNPVQESKAMHTNQKDQPTCQVTLVSADTESVESVESFVLLTTKSPASIKLQDVKEYAHKSLQACMKELITMSPGFRQNVELSVLVKQVPSVLEEYASIPDSSVFYAHSYPVQEENAAGAAGAAGAADDKANDAENVKSIQHAQVNAADACSPALVAELPSRLSLRAAVARRIVNDMQALKSFLATRHMSEACVFVRLSESVSVDKKMLFGLDCVDCIVKGFGALTSLACTHAGNDCLLYVQAACNLIITLAEHDADVFSEIVKCKGVSTFIEMLRCCHTNQAATKLVLDLLLKFMNSSKTSALMVKALGCNELDVVCNLLQACAKTSNLKALVDLVRLTSQHSCLAKLMVAEKHVDRLTDVLQIMCLQSSGLVDKETAKLVFEALINLLQHQKTQCRDQQVQAIMSAMLLLADDLVIVQQACRIFGWMSKNCNNWTMLDNKQVLANVVDLLAVVFEPSKELLELDDRSLSDMTLLLCSALHDIMRVDSALRTCVGVDHVLINMINLECKLSTTASSPAALSSAALSSAALSSAALSSARELLRIVKVQLR